MAYSGQGEGDAGGAGFQQPHPHFPAVPFMQQGPPLPTQPLMRSPQAAGVMSGPIEYNGAVPSAGTMEGLYAHHQHHDRGHQKRAYFIFTGFDKFGSCNSNPTKTLVSYLPKVLVQEGILDPSQLVHTEVVKVHTEAVSKVLNNIREKVRNIPGNARFFWIHLGLVDGTHTMQVELNAVNENNFAIPDEAGSQIREQPIDPRDHYQRVLSTPIDLPSVVLQLQHSGHPINLSADAGRFLVSMAHLESNLSLSSMFEPL
eukprot:gb/GECG01013249.1/.p1 GENE.gb/GECG01013249.1/~~gb/GECG01013249.1/.p1  ORF type:complete len:258 (+),score=15.13 gb/GECG01013249.1/:1-774(+)